VGSLKEKDGMIDPGINGTRFLKQKNRSSRLDTICLRIGT